MDQQTAHSNEARVDSRNLRQDSRGKQNWAGDKSSGQAGAHIALEEHPEGGPDQER
jgi:hypothetical protein